MKLSSETENLFTVLRQSVKPKPVTAIEKLIEDAPDRDLCRINALAFAARHKFNEEDVLAAFLHATASGTKDVPGHIENAESRAVQKSRNYIFLIELVPGGKGERVDTAEITVRAVVDELFDRAYRLWLRRFSQSIQESVGFTGKFHVTIRLITLAVTVCLGKRKASNRCAKPCPSPMDRYA